MGGWVLVLALGLGVAWILALATGGVAAWFLWTSCGIAVALAALSLATVIRALRARVPG